MNHIINERDFVCRGYLYVREESGRCYRYDEPAPRSRAAKKGLSVRVRISQDNYEKARAFVEEAA